MEDEKQEYDTALDILIDGLDDGVWSIAPLWPITIEEANGVVATVNEFEITGSYGEEE